MPLEVINEIMGQRNGMGETGESYLVGSDLLMRSDSYLSPETHSVGGSFKNPELGSVKTQATQRAFAGESGADIIIDYNGNPVLSAFSTINIGSGIQWAVLAEIDESEAFAGVTTLNNILLTIACVGALLIVGFAVLISKVLSAPILNLSNKIQQVQQEGNFSIEIDNQYKDEVGETSRALAIPIPPLIMWQKVFLSALSEVLLIKKALDSSATSTMIADTNYNLLYTNNALNNSMNDAQSDIKTVLHNFDASDLVGKKIDIFYQEPEQQRILLDQLTDTHTTNVKFGDRTFNIKASVWVLWSNG